MNISPPLPVFFNEGITREAERTIETGALRFRSENDIARFSMVTETSRVIMVIIYNLKSSNNKVASCCNQHVNYDKAKKVSFSKY